MALKKIPFRPGIVKETTNYANEGGWFDGDKIRFRAGLPESIGGWKQGVKGLFKGSCRSMHDWVSLDKNRFLALGTHLKFYILWGSTFYDITPIRAPLADIEIDDPFQTQGVESSILIVHDQDHNATKDDFVTFSGATGFDAFTPEMLNREHQVVQVLDTHHYTIDVGTPSLAAGVSGGGPDVWVEYQISTGLDFAVPGTGWGAGPWGGSPLEGETHPPPPKPEWVGWGESYTFESVDLMPFSQIRLWSQDNFGEDLFFCAYEGPIYCWNRTGGLETRAVLLANVPGAQEVPRVATVVLMSEADRHVVALGCSPGALDILDPMLVRWSDQEHWEEWRPMPSTSAGELRLSSGSRIVTGLRTRQEILIWTDKNLHSMRFIGMPYVFSIVLINEAVSIISPNAAVNAGGRVFWMDRNGFYSYTGQVDELPCTVRDYVFSDFNFGQQAKVHGGHNRNFQEVIWFYPSKASQEVDRYAIYNYVENVWSIGTLERTCWLDIGWSAYPMATAQGRLYFHEYGFNAGEDPMPAWVQSSDVDLDDGDSFMFVRKLIPDVHFRGDAQEQALGLTLKMRSAPGGSYVNDARYQVTPLTRTCWMRARGRQVALRAESNSLGTAWRLGVQRFDLQPDGKR